MTRELFLNELSLIPAPSVADARRRMSRLVRTIAAAVTAGAERKLRLVAPLDGVALSEGYTFTQWRYDPQVSVEARTYWLGLREMAPLFDATDSHPTAKQLHSDEFLIDDRPTSALPAAGLSSGLAISLSGEVLWDAHEVVVTRRFLDGADIKEQQMLVRHASERAHVTPHEAWLARPKRPPPKSLEQVWLFRGELFPYLSFCDAVEKQFVEAETRGLFKPTLRRLIELNAISESWTAGPLVLANGSPGHPRTESEATLNEYGTERTFRCPDGQERVFSWHMSLTDGDRIHFFPLSPKQPIIIGYVGKHLKIVTG